MGGTLRGQGLGPVSQHVPVSEPGAHRRPLPHSWRWSCAGSLTPLGDSRLQIWQSRAQGGHATGLSLTGTTAKRQSEARATPIRPEPARRRGAARPAPLPRPSQGPICPRGLQLPVCIMGEGGHAISGSFWLHLFTTE